MTAKKVTDKNMTIFFKIRQILTVILSAAKVYGTTPKLTTTIKQRQLRFAGHVHRNDPVS